MKKQLILTLICLCFFQFSFAQKSVTGKVTDSNGDVLPGVTIQIKGTNSGEVTDFDGKYTLKITKNDITLVFSYLGMKTKEIIYTGQTVLNVMLEDEANRLNEIVVIGYGAVKKGDLTGTISSVKDSLIEVSKSPNLFDAIQGRIAGVNITSSSGEPGAAVNFNIRGSNSVYGSGSPLFVIDGVQIDIDPSEVANSGVGSVANLDPLATINPLDIESIEVLKDASATAIYGSRGANGVVIITTKGGKNGDVSFNYTSSIGFQTAANRIDVITPEEYLLYREVRDPGNGFTNVNGGPRDFSNIPSQNWQDQVLRTAEVQNHFISASGGSENTKYSASAGFLDQQGLVIENEYSKYNFRINATHKQSDKLEFGFNLNTSFTETSGVANQGSGGDEFNGVVQLMVIANPWELLDLTQQEEASQDFLSPLSLIEEGEKILRFSRTIGSFYAQYKLTDHLTWRSHIGANFSGSKMQEFHSSNSLFGWRWNGRAVIRQTETSSYNFYSTLRYMKTFKGGHWLNVLGGIERFRYSRESFFNDIIGFENQELGFNNIAIGQTFREYSSDRLISKRMSYFSRINYTYKGKYLFTFNARADGSDKFGPNNRWGYFTGGAFAWRVNRENFMKDIKEINDLKFRVSYGQTGNERIPPFTYLARVDNTWYSSNDALNFGLSPGTFGNPDLKWETTTQFNIGFDMGLFKDRINLTFDYYNKLTTDMLIDAPVPGQSGFNSQWGNLGSVQNRGYEFSLSTVNINTPNFKWSSDFNISTNLNEIKDLGDIEFIPTLVPGGWITNPGRVMVGKPIGVMYGYVFDGIHQEGNPEGAVPGSMKYRDLNGDGIIDDANDRTVIGDSNPKHIGGLNNTFSYKNFTLSMFWQWSYGNDVFNAARLRSNGFQPFMNITRDYYESAWTPENMSNVAPAFGKIEPVASSYYVEDASFLRLKTINLSYDLPRKLFANSQIKSLRLFVSANNLLTFTKYSGFDPEVSHWNPLIRGFERFSYPRARSIIIGLNLNF
ncbi:SusC/RagA family TonB-linked outer membrane protein [Polaribacter tangerinus]|uniref:SusC/RagA family TonB-linked outer membrane protein n=1 Tax=Polaribacter tangerinus TaxID=1920034 RepID=UPI000B4B42EB|nr:TonB-dependent receptor [Polaribacter tangerinus]